MTDWRYKIELCAVLGKCNEEHDLSRFEEPCPAEVREAVAKEITKALPLVRFAKQVRAVKSIAEFNRVLARIYDEADEKLVWCGM